MPRKKVHRSKSKRNRREGRNSHDERTQGSHDEAARRARDQGSGVDNKSANARLLVLHTSRRALDLDQAAMASDRSKGRKTLDYDTVRARSKKSAYRVEDPDSSDGSSDTGTASSDTSTTSSDTGSVSSLSSMELPEPYDGRADQMAFDIWEYQVTTWAKYSKVSYEQVMYIFPRLVSGKAASCFFTHCTPSRYLPPIEPSLEGVLRVIHKYCFPPNYEMTLHKELVSLTQGNLRVRDFAHGLKFRAKRLSYVSKKFLAASFFFGVHGYIRVRLIEEGMSHDNTDLDTLLKHASRYEQARATLRAYERGGEYAFKLFPSG
ncbi:hypothetical protein BJ322DRAFT_434178 [Thelephora terrestris]|uniref:Retrotransposon gag domain-containing protein n=1 Tax=Thelephora terrestris TaxID=56493 RepID=A0A9P6LBY1_9AGAM|nr:hypothetical protein BJ322DRAFT_434178 [Thelephora terrestris]